MQSYLPSDTKQAWLLDALKGLIATAGPRRFLVSRLLEPNERSFPDPFTPDAHGVHRLALRLLPHVDLGHLRPTVLGLPAEGALGFQDYAPEGQHTGAPVWFAGIDGEECRFGVNLQSLEDPDRLVATMCHEIAHLWRYYHGVPRQPPELEERLTDVSTVYLGFGILTTNGTYVYRTFASVGSISILPAAVGRHSGGGYLGPNEMSFLLAAQAAARRLTWGERRNLQGLLGATQAASFQAAYRQLSADPSLAAHLGLNEIPRRRGRALLPGPLRRLAWLRDEALGDSDETRT